MDNSFGELVKRARTQKNWTVEQFMEQLGTRYSRSYFTKIELHAEIPNPTGICRMATVLGLNPRHLLDIAWKEKVEHYGALLRKRYEASLELHNEFQSRKENQ